MGESEKLSHRPFAALKGDAGRKLEKQLRQQREAELEAQREAARRAAAEAAAAARAPEDEASIFAQEMAGVRPLSARDNYVPEQRPPARPPVQDDDAEAMAQLADLVEGRAAFDFTASDERIEGISMGLDRRLLRRLRQGNFAVQAHLDLHGLTRQEARPLVESFIVDARARRRRCVLIVHGRGLNSKDQIPVLKESLRVWLAKGRIARSVLAFCSARPSDGGSGAVYVLLRK